jgi:hypothetical protein
MYEYDSNGNKRQIVPKEKFQMSPSRASSSSSSSDLSNNKWVWIGLGALVLVILIALFVWLRWSRTGSSTTTASMGMKKGQRWGFRFY